VRSERATPQEVLKEKQKFRREEKKQYDAFLTVCPDGFTSDVLLVKESRNESTSESNGQKGKLPMTTNLRVSLRK
jgi:hypothetical protein